MSKCVCGCLERITKKGWYTAMCMERIQPPGTTKEQFRIARKGSPAEAARNRLYQAGREPIDRPAKKVYAQQPAVKAMATKKVNAQQAAVLVKAAIQARSQQPTVKAAIQAHNQQPAVKAARKHHDQQPAVKAHNKATKKAYAQRPAFAFAARIKAYRKLQTFLETEARYGEHCH